jgi:outer membrane lipoprotein-sorting protein
MIGRRHWAAAACWAFAAPGFAADTLESVQRDIETRLDRLTSIQARLELEQEIEIDGVRQVGRTTGTYEIVNRGNQSPFRSDMTMTETLIPPGQKPRKREATVLTIFDGRHVYVLQKEEGQTTAQKMFLDPKWAIFGDKRFLRELAKDHNLALGKDETVDGIPTWVIQATPRDSQKPPFLRTSHYFQKETGLWVQAISRRSDGKTVMTTRVRDIRLNADIPADRFSFHAPPGVTLVDRTAPPRPPTATAPGRPPAR